MSCGWKLPFSQPYSVPKKAECWNKSFCAIKNKFYSHLSDLFLLTLMKKRHYSIKDNNQQALKILKTLKGHWHWRHWHKTLKCSQQNTSNKHLQIRPALREPKCLGFLLTQAPSRLLLLPWLHVSMRWQILFNSSWLSLCNMNGQHLNENDSFSLHSPYRNESGVNLLYICIRKIKLYWCASWKEWKDHLPLSVECWGGEWSRERKAGWVPGFYLPEELKGDLPSVRVSFLIYDTVMKPCLPPRPIVGNEWDHESKNILQTVMTPIAASSQHLSSSYRGESVSKDSPQSKGGNGDLKIMLLF